MPDLAELLAIVPQCGRVEWIGRSPSRRAPIEVLERASIEPGTGLAGDHHAQSGKSQRQVTLIQQEHLAAVGALLNRGEVNPALLRRNVVVSGINLLSLKAARFRVGPVLFEGTGPCAPCSLMEDNLGPGGYSAMRGHGGITAVVIDGGEIRLGDAVTFSELVRVEERPV